MTAVQHTLDVRYVPIDHVVPNPNNIRRHIGDTSELTESIRKLGVLEPLVAYHDADRDVYVILGGERRWTAARDAELAEVPVSVRDQPDRLEEIEIMLAENLEREELDPIDQGLALAELRRSNRYRSYDKLGQAVHRSKTWVQQRVALVEKLPEACWEQVRSGEVSLENAVTVATSKLDDKAKARVLTQPWTIEQERKKAAKAAKLRDLRAEHGTVVEHPPAIGAKYPWGAAKLGDHPGALNVPAGLHTGCPGHAARYVDWEDRVDFFCTEPLQHGAADFVEYSGDDPATIAGEATPLDWLGITTWKAVNGHAAMCAGHAEIDLPWSFQKIKVCTDPTRHTDKTRADHLSVEDLVEQGDRGPQAPPRWQLTPDARELLEHRLEEAFAGVQAEARQLTLRALRGEYDECTWNHSDDDPDAAVPTELHQVLAVIVVAHLEAIAFTPHHHLGDGDLPYAEGIQWALQACIDVGAPPPNLDVIRTRLDVLTKGAVGQDEEGTDG